jgi:hypothetical protein
VTVGKGEQHERRAGRSRDQTNPLGPMHRRMRGPIRPPASAKMGGSCRGRSARSLATPLLAIRQRDAPELENVTIDPKSTALMVIDFLKIHATRSVVRDVSRPALMSRSCSTRRALMVFWCCTAYRRPVHPVIKAALGPPCRVDLNELKGGREWHRPSIFPATAPDRPQAARAPARRKYRDDAAGFC